MAIKQVLCPFTGSAINNTNNEYLAKFSCFSQVIQRTFQCAANIFSLMSIEKTRRRTYESRYRPAESPRDRGERVYVSCRPKNPLAIWYMSSSTGTLHMGWCTFACYTNVVTVVNTDRKPWSRRGVLYIPRNKPSDKDFSMGGNIIYSEIWIPLDSASSTVREV